MSILRFELGEKYNSCYYLYRNGKEAKSSCASSMAELAKHLEKLNISGIYVHRGPGGFSRLRAMHAYAQGLAEALNVPLASYVKWTSDMTGITPKNTTSLQPIYK